MGVATIIALGAIAFAVAIQAQPLIGLAIPGLVAVSVACARFPSAALGLIVLLCGTSGTLRAFTGIPAAVIADLLLAGLWASVLYGLAVAPRVRKVWIWPGVAVLGVYICITAFEVLTAGTMWLGIEGFRIATWHLAAVALVAYGGWKAGLYERVTQAVIVVTAVVGAYATFRWLVGPAAAERELAEQFSGPFNLIAGELAVFGSFTSRLQLGFWTAAMLPFCLACALAFTDRWRYLAGAACVLTAIPLLASQGRAALVAAAIGILMILCVAPLARGIPGVRIGSTIAAAVSVLLLGTIAYTVTIGGSSETEDRYEAVLNPENDLAYSQRVLKWRVTIDEIEQHPFGEGLGTAGAVGLQNQETVNVARYNVENSYLKIAFEQGVVVMGLFVLGAGLVLAGLLRQALAAPNRVTAALAMGSAGTLLATLVLFTSGEYIDDLVALAVWIVVGIGIGRSLAQAPPDAEIEGTR